MFESEYNFNPLNARKQHWTQARFSYLEHPRPNHGIMLVLNGQIDFVSPQMDTLCAKSGDIVFLPKNAYYEARFRIELGEIEKQENKEFGKRIAKVADVVIIVNQVHREAIESGLQEENFNEENIIKVNNLTEVIALFKTFLKEGDIILLENDLPDSYT